MDLTPALRGITVVTMALNLRDPVAAALATALASRTAREWQDWGEEHGIPLAAVV